MMNEVEFKPIDSISEETLVQLIYAIFPENDSHWNYQREVDGSLKNMVDYTSAVAWKDDEPIGVILCSDVGFIQIDHIGVLTNHQRMGVGRMLLRHAVDNADEDVMTLIPKDNKAMIELLEEEGFKLVEENDDHLKYLYEI